MARRGAGGGARSRGDGDGTAPPDVPELTPAARSSPSRSRRRWSARSSSTPCPSSCPRALPDVRDGLKPVHRRILYSMDEQNLRPDRPHAKCAKVVGEVMGTYHPHGDIAIYDALARMVQDFSLRHMLDRRARELRRARPRRRPRRHALHGVPAGPPGHGDARRHRRGDRRLRVPNYDGSTEEPIVLPARFPNLLVNGSQGIAVGMATNIPPHNLGEVIDATVHMLEHPEATPDELMQFVKGPDFPTGAQILGPPGDPRRLPHRQGLHQDARRGRDRRGTQRDADRRHRHPRTRRRSRRSSRRSQSWRTRRVLEGISDVQNDSAGKHAASGHRRLKRDANANVVLNNLYKHTPMQTNFAVNMVALVDGVPRTLNLAQALGYYVDHQIEVVTRRSEYRLDKAQRRAHIVEGLLKAIDMLDAVIATIRNSDDRPAARDALMAEPFSFTRGPGGPHPGHDPRPAHPARAQRARRGDGEAARRRSPSSRPSWATRPSSGGSSPTSSAPSRPSTPTPAGPRSPTTPASSGSRT